MYQINLSVTHGETGSSGNSILGSSLVRLEVEQLDSQFHDRWHGEFTSQCTFHMKITIVRGGPGLTRRLHVSSFIPIDIEEITHKAGNFKKFNVFVKMLCAAFTEEKDSVLFVDLLTYADLELLKARKSGGGGGGSQSQSQQGSGSNPAAVLANKRYAILTYSGEFDRVHYPLPLMHEDPMAPNVSSLRRTITRLRQQLSEQGAVYQANLSATASGADVSTTEKDRERDNVRQIVTQLRQDNTELRHRLRQAESRAASAVAAGNGSSKGGHRGTTPSSSAAASSADLVASNGKLRSQVESLRKELAASTTAYEKLRIEAAKEIARYKARLSAALPGAAGSVLGLGGEETQSGPGQQHQQRSFELYMSSSKTGTTAVPASSSSLSRLDATRGPLGAASGTKTTSMTANEREMALRRRIAALERDLSLATTAGGVGRSGSTGRARTPSVGTTAASRVPSSVSPWTADHRRATSATGTGSRTATSRSTTPSLPTRSSTPPVGRGRAASSGSASGSGQVHRSSVSPSFRGHSRSDTRTSTGERRSTSSAGSRPPTPTRVNGQASRFDPTAYQRNKDDAQDRRERGRREWEKTRRSVSATPPSEDRRGRRSSSIRRSGYGSDDYSVGGERGRPTGGSKPPRSDSRTAGTHGSRYGTYESGYSSAGSQASRRSARSVGSVGSDYGQGRPTRQGDGPPPSRGRSWLNSGSDAESEAKAPPTVKKQRRKKDSGDKKGDEKKQRAGLSPSQGLLDMPTASRPPVSAAAAASTSGDTARVSREAVMEAGSPPRMKRTGAGKRQPLSASLQPQLPDSVTRRDVQQQVMQHLQQRSPRTSLEELVARSPPAALDRDHHHHPVPADSPDSLATPPDTADRGQDDKENEFNRSSDAKTIDFVSKKLAPSSSSLLSTTRREGDEDRGFDGLLSLAEESMQLTQSQGQSQSHHSVSFAPAGSGHGQREVSSPVLDAAAAILSTAKMSMSMSTPTAMHTITDANPHGTPVNTSSSPPPSSPAPTTTAPATMVAVGTPEGDISEIDRRILALQNYLESARVGIMRESIGGST